MDRILSFLSVGFGHLLQVLSACAVGSCSGFAVDVLLPPEPNDLPEFRDSTTGHRVLTVLWRAPLFEGAGPSSDAGPVPKAKPEAADKGKDSGGSSPGARPGTAIDPAFPIDFQRHGAPEVDSDATRVFVGSVGGLFHCFDALDGRTVWRKTTSSSFDATPTVAAETVYTGSADGVVYAFRASDGETLWTYDASGSVDGRPVLARDRLLVTTDANTLLCLDAPKGEWRWSYKRDIPVGRFQVKGVSSPTVVGEQVFVGFSDGYLADLAFGDGSVRTSRSLAAKGDVFADADSDPLLVDGTLFVGSFSRGLVALDAKDMSEKWHFQVEGPSSFANKDGIIYLSTAGAKVLAIDGKTGRLVWRFNAKKGDLSRPVVSGRWLLVSSAVHSLMVLDRYNGKLIQIFNPGKGATAPPTVAGGRVFWVSNGEVLYCMGIAQ